MTTFYSLNLIIDISLTAACTTWIDGSAVFYLFSSTCFFSLTTRIDGSAEFWEFHIPYVIHISYYFQHITYTFLPATAWCVSYPRQGRCCSGYRYVQHKWLKKTYTQTRAHTHAYIESDGCITPRQRHCCSGYRCCVENTNTHTHTHTHT